MMQSNEYSAYDSYDYVGGASNEPLDDESGMLLVAGAGGGATRTMDMNFDDPKIASMPKILLMGPRRGGKSSIQVSGLVGHCPACVIGVVCTDVTGIPTSLVLKARGVSKNVAA
jgi:hypothetical protein